MDKKSTYGLKPEQLADLLSIGIEDANFLERISSDKATEKLMEAWMITSLPKDASLLDALLVIMGQMGYGVESLAGKSLAESGIRSKTGCSVVALVSGERTQFDLDPNNPLKEDAEIILIGSIEAENKFFEVYGNE